MFWMHISTAKIFQQEQRFINKFTIKGNKSSILFKIF